MAAVKMGVHSTGLNESIFSLLDFSWHSKSVLNLSAGVRVPSTETTAICPQIEESISWSEADCPSRTPIILEECSSPPSVVGDDVQLTGSTGSGMWYVVDESEMKRVFNRFDENADGMISRDELRRYMSCWGIDMSDAEAISLIKSVDQNSDGGVDFQEFFSIYQTLGPAAATVVEVKTATEEEDVLLEAFRVFDVNQDGFISAQELQAVLVNLGMPEGKSLMSCQNMIRSVDRDGNGQCDIQEFQRMMSAQLQGV